jgi:nucleotide-binding universal stress UspA family protein
LCAAGPSEFRQSHLVTVKELKMIHRILLPLDIAQDCRQQMRYGSEVAAAMNADLCLLHVAGSGRRGYPWKWPAAWDDETGVLPAHRAVLSGRPAEKIAGYADSVDADLIVMPTRGHGLLGQLLLGSTTMDVLRMTSRPLWVAKPPSVRMARPIRSGRILCGVGLEAEGQSVLHYAARCAAAWNGELLIVHAVPEISEAMLMLYGVDDSAKIELLPRAAEQAISSMAASIDVPWQVKTQVGDVAETLRKFARRWRADVIMVGRGRRTGQWQLGANIGNIMMRAPCPVMIYPGRAVHIGQLGHRIFCRDHRWQCVESGAAASANPAETCSPVEVLTERRARANPPHEVENLAGYAGSGGYNAGKLGVLG